jgi:hypothetical protein
MLTKGVIGRARGVSPSGDGGSGSGRGRGRSLSVDRGSAGGGIGSEPFSSNNGVGVFGRGSGGSPFDDRGSGSRRGGSGQGGRGCGGRDFARLIFYTPTFPPGLPPTGGGDRGSNRWGFYEHVEYSDVIPNHLNFLMKKILEKEYEVEETGNYLLRV